MQYPVGTYEQEETSMHRIIDETRSPGLCSTCNNAAACVHRKRRGFDALWCEMFDNYVPVETAGINPASINPIERPAFEAGTHTVGNKQEGRPLKGLCLNCENRGDCMFPKPEGGVWHCEEFR